MPRHLRTVGDGMRLGIGRKAKSYAVVAGSTLVCLPRRRGRTRCGRHSAKPKYERRTPRVDSPAPAAGRQWRHQCRSRRRRMDPSPPAAASADEERHHGRADGPGPRRAPSAGHARPRLHASRHADQRLSLAEMRGHPVILAFYPPTGARSAATRSASSTRCCPSFIASGRNSSASRPTVSGAMPPSRPSASCISRCSPISSRRRGRPALRRLSRRRGRRRSCAVRHRRQRRHPLVLCLAARHHPGADGSSRRWNSFPAPCNDHGRLQHDPWHSPDRRRRSRPRAVRCAGHAGRIWRLPVPLLRRGYPI